MKSSNRAFSIVEVLIASAMALVLLGALISVFYSGSKIQRTARESYYISEDASVALTRLKADLKITALHSIKVWDDGFSMLSPHDLETNKGFEVTAFGAPKWKKIVHYRQEKIDDKTSRLLRWEEKTDGSTLPGAIARPSDPGDHAQTLLTNVLNVGQSVKKNGEAFALVTDSGSKGGFQLNFVRSDGPNSVHNPAEFSDGEKPHWTAGNTKLVELTLLVVEHPSDSKVAALELNAVVCPNH